MVVGSAANSDSFKVTTPSDLEICMTRLFDAPPRLVFEAMTKPEHVTQWWGRLGDGYSVPGLRDRSARRRPVAVREPPPQGRGRVPR
jgi:hypothetical protein